MFGPEYNKEILAAYENFR